MFENVRLKPRGWYSENIVPYKPYRQKVGKTKVRVKGVYLDEGEPWVYVLSLPDGSIVKQYECEKRFIPFGVLLECDVYEVEQVFFGGTFLYLDIFKRYSGGAK